MKNGSRVAVHERLCGSLPTIERRPKSKKALHMKTAGSCLMREEGHGTGVSSLGMLVRSIIEDLAWIQIRTYTHLFLI